MVFFDNFDDPLFQTSLEIPRLFDLKEKDGRITNDGNVLEFEKLIFLKLQSSISLF